MGAEWLEFSNLVHLFTLMILFIAGYVAGYFRGQKSLDTELAELDKKYAAVFEAELSRAKEAFDLEIIQVVSDTESKIYAYLKETYDLELPDRPSIKHQLN